MVIVLWMCFQLCMISYARASTSLWKNGHQNKGGKDFTGRQMISIVQTRFNSTVRNNANPERLGNGALRGLE